MSLTKEEIKNLKSSYNLTQSQINDYIVLLKEHQNKSKDEVLEIYRNFGYDIAEVRKQLTAHTKFLVSYDLHPDGTVTNYEEVPIE